MPGGPGNLSWQMPPREDDIVRRQRDQARTQRELAAGNILQGATIGAGGITVTDNGKIKFTGTGELETSGALTTSGSFTAAGAVTAGTALNADSLSIIHDATVGGDLTSATISSGTCTLTGDLTGVNVQLGSSGTVYSTYALANPVVSSYVAAYINGPDGRFGATPSARRFKQDITTKQYTVADAERLAELIVNYRLKEAVTLLGDSAAVEVGVIAEDLLTAGFPEFVIHDEQGNTVTVAYERIWLVVGSAFAELSGRVASIENRLASAGL